MGILDVKRILVTGVLTDTSLSFGVAKLAQEEGAELVLSGAGRGLSLTQRTARKLKDEVEVLELDVTNTDHLAAAATALQNKWGTLDGIMHSIAFAPQDALGGNFLDTEWNDVATALHVSAYSFKSLTMAMLPLLRSAGKSSVVGLDFDAQVTWPAYDWMGVSKAALESTSRYLARYLGEHQVRCNLVAAGPVKTVAAKGIPGFSQFEDGWDGRAPLGWDATDGSAVAKACVALLSDWFPATTGEIVHVDGGYHATGA
jgi:meromycolic acid enoyl-[acyl-carrier-protein] reductase